MYIFYLYFVFVFLGVVDQHLRAWFDDKSSENYLGGSLEEIDGQFLSLRPISQITRRPRSISDWKQWKGSCSSFHSFIHSGDVRDPCSFFPGQKCRIVERIVNTCKMYI